MTSLILGEVIIDFVQPEISQFIFEPINGGSPYNVALAMARLGMPVDLCASISEDVFGARVIDSLEAENVGTNLVQRVAEPSTLAMVQTLADGSISYSFYLTQTSIEAFSWRDVVVSDRHDHIHPGSYVALEKSLVSESLSCVRQHADSKFISFDPNIRLNLTPDPDKLRPLVEAYANLSSFIKASDEDIALLYPTMEVSEAAKYLLSMGPELVIITLGSEGSIAVHGQHSLVKSSATKLTRAGDSVGAGDSFMAACIWQCRQQGWMSRQALATMSRNDIATIMQQAGKVAGYNCQHFGCNPPSLDDLR